MARAAEGTIKVGVHHSLSGTMAISETTLKDSILMMIDQLNKDGGEAKRFVFTNPKTQEGLDIVVEFITA